MITGLPTPRHFIARWCLRIVFLLAALVLTAGALAVLLLMCGFWAARVLWFRLTGRPAPAFVMQVDPAQAFRRTWRQPSAERVVDVEARPLS